MGFSRDQVQTYIEAVMPEEKDTIRAYLEKHRIMQSLVQIPIPLDALCFTWQSSSVWNIVIPETMTAVYEAMTRELWRKDNERLEKDGFQIIGNTSPAEMDPFDATQYENLAYLAFSGLCSNVIEFQPHHRNTLYRFMKRERTSLSLDETFARLSFWRTSDPSNSLPNQSYHFIHLNFQEYFSVKHFAKAWRYDQDLEYIEFDGELPKKQLVSCRNFLAKHKFIARYDIMWRFVAGLLDEDEAQTSRFFEAIEREPVDLLGPTQQRLVMHCLAEVTQSVKLRTSLEDQLSQWLEFELSFRKTSEFVCKAEFPARAINLVSERGSEEHKIGILQPFKEGHNLPLSTVEFITGPLERGELSQRLRGAVLETFSRIPLPIRTFNAVVALMEDDDMDTTRWVDEIFFSQAPLPGDFLEAVMTRHGSQDSNTDSAIKQRTARALECDSTLPVALLQQIALWIKDQCPSTTEAVLDTLQDQHNLNEDIVRIVATVLEDQRPGMMNFAFEILQKRDDLPLDILNNMVAIYLEFEDVGPDGVANSMNIDRLSNSMLQAVTRRSESQDRDIQQQALQVLFREHEERPPVPFDDVFCILVEWLEGEDNKSRQLALSLLHGEDGLPERVTEAVMAQLQDQDQEISHLAFDILFYQDTSPTSVMDSTIRWLKVGDQDEKKAILRFLGSKYPLPLNVLNAIVQHLDDQDEDIRTTALKTLRAIRRYQDLSKNLVSAIAEQILHADVITRRAAAKTLAKIWDRQSPPVELLDDVVAELKSHDTTIREAASDSLVVFGGLHSIPDQTLGAIALHLTDPENEIRYMAAKTLRDIAHKQPFPDNILSEIAALFEDIQSKISYELVMTLQTLAEKQTFPDHILSAILACSMGRQNRVSDELDITLPTLAMTQIFPHHTVQPIVPRFEEAQRRRRVRCESVKTLLLLAKNQTLPDHVLQPIPALLRDGDNEVRFKALETLERLGYRQTFPFAILECIAGQFDILECIEDRFECPKMATAIRIVDTRGNPILPRRTYRHLVFEALVRQPGMPELTTEAMVVGGLTARDGATRYAALNMIRRLPTMSRRIRGLVIALLDDEYANVGVGVLQALASHGELSDDADPGIARLLQSASWDSTKPLLELLGTYPTLSGEVLQGITRLVGHDYDDIWRAAVDTLSVQHNLPDTIFNSKASYSSLLSRSFKEDVYCIIEDGVTYLEWPAEFGRRRLWGERSELMEAIRKIQMDLGMPMRSKEIESS